MQYNKFSYSQKFKSKFLFFSLSTAESENPYFVKGSFKNICKCIFGQKPPPRWVLKFHLQWLSFSFAVPGAPGTVWPESRGVSQDLSWGSDWPLWIISGRAPQKKQIWQAQDCRCRYSEFRRVSFDVYFKILIHTHWLFTVWNFYWKSKKKKNAMPFWWVKT